MSNEPAAPAPAGLFLGLCTLDVIQSVDHVPSPNQKVVAHDFTVAAGGPATNAAVAFAHCGGASSLVTALPTHALTEVIRADLASCGVDVTIAATYGCTPVTASILVTRSTGERAIVSPTAAVTDAALSTATDGTVTSAQDTPPWGDVCVVLIDGYYSSLAAPLCQAARAAGVPVVLDGGSFKPHTNAVLGLVDIAIVSDDFAPPGTDGDPERVFAHLFQAGVTAAAITRGARPILWRTLTSRGEVAVPAVATVDTLGAGDFFHGAFAWRLACLGRDDARLAEDLAFASAVAGRSLGSFGTRAWLTRPPDSYEPQIGARDCR